MIDRPADGCLDGVVAMRYEWLEDHCLAHAGAVREWKEEWQADRYLIGGKMFALQGEDSAGRPIVTVKLPPEEGEFLRQEYPDVQPGYYMNKIHWNSVYLDGSVPDDVLRGMVSTSYASVVENLPKKVQREIAG